MIRNTQIEDSKELSELIDAVARERKYLGSTEGFGEESTKAFIQHLRESGGVHIVYVCESSITGWCDITPCTFEGTDHVGRLGMGLEAGLRGKGYGIELIKAALAKAFQGKITKVELEVFETNKAAISLYEKLGFVLEGKRKEARKLDGRIENTLLYALFKD